MCLLCLQPFWPMGTGIARGFLAAMDSGWMVKSWAQGKTPLEVLAERWERGNINACTPRPVLFLCSYISAATLFDVLSLQGHPFISKCFTRKCEISSISPTSVSTNRIRVCSKDWLECARNVLLWHWEQCDRDLLLHYHITLLLFCYISLSQGRPMGMLLFFRESIYRLLPQTTPENVSKNFSQYSVDPTTRYPNISLNFLKPSQVSMSTNKPQCLFLRFHY